MNNKLNRPMKYLHLTILLLASEMMMAQDFLKNDTIKKIDEVVISYQADKATPLSFQDLTSSELKIKSTGQEPSFILSETPSVTVYSDAGNMQGYSYFRLRGIDQTRINISLDGVPLNEPEDQGAYFSNYPDIFNSISKIQIQRGVGTSKNGVASYGGSVQLFSTNLHDSAKTTLGLDYGSFNSMRAFAEYKSGVVKRKSIYMRASQIYSDGYKYNSSNNSRSIFISSGLFLDKSSWKISFLAGHQQNEMAWLGVPDSLISIDRRTNANSGEKDKFTQCFIHLQNKWSPSRYSNFQTGLYATFLEGGYDFDLNNFLGFPSTDELYHYAFKSKLFGLFSNYSFSKRNFNWTTGLHCNIYNRQHTGTEKSLGKLYQNTGYKNEMSAFTKLDYTFDWLTFFADIQFRYSSFDYKGAVPMAKMDWYFVNPKAGISAELKPNSTIYYSIGSTGREPTRNDLFGGNDDLLQDNLGNPVLSIKTPEHVLDQEIGFRHQSPKLNLNFNLYYMNFQNEIVLDGKYGPNGLALTDKVEQSFRTGLELNLSYQITKHFLLVHNSSFNYSRVKEQNVTFAPILTPDFIINQEITYVHDRLSVALMARYQDKSFIDFANTSTVDGYILLNGRIDYSTRFFEFALFVNNITDTEYFNNGYVEMDGSKKLFVQSPRSFSISIKYSF
jgi:iron complex outermembrane recepter protein